MKYTLTGFAAAFGLALAATITPAFAQDTIKVGAMAPMTGGTYSVVGEDMRRGFAMAVEEVNRKGGIGGKKVEMILGDTQANPTVGIGVAQKLYVRDNVAAVVGMYSSTVAKAVASAVAQHKKPLFVVGASSNIVEDAVGYEPWYFHFYPYNYYLAETTTAFFKSLNPQPKTVAIAYENGVYGTSGAKLMKEYLEPGGFKIVAEEGFKTGSSSLLPLLSRLKAANPDVLLVQAYSSDNILIMKQSREVDFSPQLFYMPEIFSQEFYPAVGKSGEYAAGYTTWIPESTYPESKRWIADFRQMFPERPDPQDWAPMAYTAMKMLLNAIADAGVEPEKLIQRLEREQIDSPFGKIGFSDSKNGRHQALSKLSIVQWQDGQKVIVFPPELAGSHQTRFPTPAWRDRKG